MLKTFCRWQDVFKEGVELLGMFELVLKLLIEWDIKLEDIKNLPPRWDPTQTTVSAINKDPPLFSDEMSDY